MIDSPSSTIAARGEALDPRGIAIAPTTPASAEARARPQRHGRGLRPALVVVHRYVGLLLAVFLLMAGTTGCLLAFYDELDAALAPELAVVAPPFDGAPMQDPFVLREALERQVPAVRARQVPLRPEPGRSLGFFTEAAPGHEGDALDDEWFVDPYTGAVLGSRRWGDVTQGAKNLMPFVYRLHYGLALDRVGSVLMGLVALLWTLDCFVGAWLTFPAPARAPGGRRGPRAWLSRWRSSWVLRTGKLFSLVLSWHRASGLWVWGMLLVFAWSSVALNLREVYDPVMGVVLPRHDAYRELPTLEVPKAEPGLAWEAAHRLARVRMAELAGQHGFQILDEHGLDHDPSKGVFRYRVRSSLDVSERYPATTALLDADTGALVGFDAPTGQAAGNTVTTWLYNLHWGAVGGWGLPYRIFVSLMGLCVATLSVTGVWIWLRKRARSRSMRESRSTDDGDGGGRGGSA